MGRYSLNEFITNTRQQDRGDGLFELESERVLEVNLDGLVWTKMGSMVAYRGNIKFTREGMLEHGIGKLLKRSVSGERTKLTKAEGHGVLYLADEGKKISILDLSGETLFVNGNDILAFEDGIDWDIKMMRKVAGMLAGGLFKVKLKGKGLVAITTHHDPVTLMVRPDATVVTDPNATVAWSGSLKSGRWGIHFIQVHPMGCGLAAPEQECEIARIVRVAAKPTHTRIHCGGSLRAATPRIGRATQPHAAPEQ